MSTLQVPISLLDGTAIDDVLSWARARGVGVIGNQPLRKGRILQVGMSSRHGFPVLEGRRSLAQAAIRVATQLTGVSTVLTGTSSAVHLQENLGALDTPPLTAEEIEVLRSALAAS